MGLFTDYLLPAGSIVAALVSPIVPAMVGRLVRRLRGMPEPSGEETGEGAGPRPPAPEVRIVGLAAEVVARIRAAVQGGAPAPIVLAPESLAALIEAQGETRDASQLGTDRVVDALQQLSQRVRDLNQRVSDLSVTASELCDEIRASRGSTYTVTSTVTRTG